MTSTRLTTLFLALILRLACPAAAGDGAQAAFRTLQGLVGSWRLTKPATDKQRAFRIIYRMISANTALVESFGDPAGQPTETIYHLDGDRLMATHYCAQGNQPVAMPIQRMSDMGVIYKVVYRPIANG